MKQAVTGHSDRPHRSPAAAAHVASRSTTTSVAFTDNRPEAIVQRTLADAIHHSPYMIAQRQQLRGMFGEAAQRQAGPEDEELVQGKFSSIQRQAGQEEEELLQGKFALAQGKEVATQFEPDPVPRKNDTGLPDNLKSGIESLSGMSMGHVKVHYNSSQPSQLNALAYAQGSDIHLAPGQEQHLPHEAWHIVQQAQGRVQPTMQMKDGVPVNDNEGLEHEADRMGARAMAVGELAVSSSPLQDQAEGMEERTGGDLNKAFSRASAIPDRGSVLARKIDSRQWEEYRKTVLPDAKSVYLNKMVKDMTFDDSKAVYEASWQKHQDDIRKPPELSPPAEVGQPGWETGPNSLVHKVGLYYFHASLDKDDKDLVNLHATRNPEAEKWTMDDWTERRQVDYFNAFRLSSGTFSAYESWGTRDDQYYGKKGRLPNSEIIYHQIQQALELGMKSGNSKVDGARLTSIKRGRIVNQDTRITMMHTEPGSFTSKMMNGQGVLTSHGDESAVLGTPNGRAVYLLVMQHGIPQIKKIAIEYQYLIFDIDQVVWDVESYPVSNRQTTGQGRKKAIRK